ncbi:MAG TPA: lytic transglycosylase domain-containing protein, partial [Thermoanaerobaculia bacterium]
KLTSYRAIDDEIELGLVNGGKLVVALEQIDRIVDDEVMPEEEVAELRAELEEGLLPRRSWRFDDASAPLFASRYNAMILDAARKFDVDAALVSAVIKAESDFNPRALSPKGARGLMQLMPGTARRFGVTNSYDPIANIYGGTRYLRWLLDTFDRNADLAVAAYNAGEGNVWKYKGVPPFRETVHYLQRIARHFSQSATPSAPVVGGS